MRWYVRMISRRRSYAMAKSQSSERACTTHATILQYGVSEMSHYCHIGTKDTLVLAHRRAKQKTRHRATNGGNLQSSR
jgi:hypothetical protein